VSIVFHHSSLLVTASIGIMFLYHDLLLFLLCYTIEIKFSNTECPSNIPTMRTRQTYTVPYCMNVDGRKRVILIYLYRFSFSLLLFLKCYFEYSIIVSRFGCFDICFWRYFNNAMVFPLRIFALDF
jgi:hypothetical protein